MGDLTRIDQAQAIEVTDGVSQTAVLATALPGASDVGLVIRDAAQGQQTMAASRPVVIASNQSAIPVSGTVTLSSQTVTLSSQTVTTVPSGTQTVTGTVTLTSQTVTLSSQTVTLATGSTGELSVNVNGGAIIATTTQSPVTVSNVTTTTLLNSNVSRKQAVLFNGGSNLVYIKFGAIASSTSYTVILYPNGVFELPVPTWAGRIDALAATAPVVINVTEF